MSLPSLQVQFLIIVINNRNQYQLTFMALLLTWFATVLQSGVGTGRGGVSGQPWEMTTLTAICSPVRVLADLRTW